MRIGVDGIGMPHTLTDAAEDTPIVRLSTAIVLYTRRAKAGKAVAIDGPLP